MKYIVAPIAVILIGIFLYLILTKSISLTDFLLGSIWIQLLLITNEED